MSTFNFTHKKSDAPLFGLEDLESATGIIADYGFLATQEKGESDGELRVYVVLPSESEYRVFRANPQLRRGEWEFDVVETSGDYDEDTDRGLLGNASSLAAASALIKADLLSVSIRSAAGSNSIAEMKRVVGKIVGGGDVVAIRRSVKSTTIRWGVFASLVDRIAEAESLAREMRECNVTRAYCTAKLAHVADVCDFARKNLSASAAEKWISALFAIRDIRRTRQRTGAERHAGECYRAARLLLRELPRRQWPELQAIVDLNFCWIRSTWRDYCIGGYGIPQEERQNVVNRINMIIHK